MLRKTGAKFELITKECMPEGKPEVLMQLINDNIRGGLSCAFIPHALANNPDCGEFDESKPKVWLGSLDATNLYGWCMSQMLPVGEYKSVELPPSDQEALDMFHSLLDAYDAEHEVGYMLEVEYEIAPEDHDNWDLAPVVRKQVLWEELSRRQQELKWSRLSEKKRLRAVETGVLPKSLTSAFPKLVPHLGPRRQAISIAHARFLRSRNALHQSRQHLVLQAAADFEGVRGGHCSPTEGDQQRH